MHPVRAQPPVEQAGGRGRRALHRGDYGIYVLYLLGFKWGANGYLLAIISGDFVSVLFLSFTGKLWNFVEFKGINRDLWKQMLRFSLPMIPAQISFWVINASDLFFVREMCNGLDGNSGEAWSGLLSTGYFCPPF